MPDDEIMREVRANREVYARRFNFDIRAIFRDAKAREKAEGRKLVSSEPRRTSTVEKVEPQR